MKTFKRKLVDNSMDLFIEVDGQYVANDNLFKRVIPAMLKPEVLQASQREQEQNIQTNTQNKDEKTLIKELSVSISKAYKDLDKNKQDRLEVYENNGYKIEVGSKPPLSYVAFYDSDLSNDNSVAMYLYASTNTSSVLLASQIEARLNQVVQEKILDNRNAFYVDRENILGENNYVSSEITPQKDDLAIFANLVLKKELDKRVVAQEYPKEHFTEQNLKNSQMVDEIKSQGEIKSAGNSRILSDKELIESMKATPMEQWSKEQKELFDDMPKFKQDQILDTPKIKYDEEVFGKIPYNELSFRNQMKVVDEARFSAKGKELQAQYDKLQSAKYTAGEGGRYPSGAQLAEITKAQNKIAAQRDELINTYIKEYNEKVAGNSRIPSDKADDDSVEKIKAEIETAPAHSNYKGGEAPNAKSEIHMVEKFFVEKVDDEFVTQKRFVNEQENNALKDQFEAEIAKVILEVEPAWRENMLNVPLSLKANQETYLSNILKESDVDYATALAQDDKNTIYTVAEQKIVEKILKERQEHRIEIFQDDYVLTDKTTGNAINKNSNLASIMLDKILPHGLGNHPADELSTFWFNHCSSWQRDNRVTIDDIDIQKATKLTYKKEKLTLDECAELSKFLARNAIEFSDNKPREVADGVRKFVPSNALYKVAEGLNDELKKTESRELKKFLVKHMSSTFAHTDEVPDFLVERNGSAIFTRINRDYLSEINGKFNEVDEVRLKHISNYLSDRKEAGLANHRAEFETAFFVCDDQFKEAFHRAELALAEKLDGQGAATEIASYLETNEFVAYRADHIKELLRVEERAAQEFRENYKEPLDLDEANKRIDNLLDNEIPKASEQFYYKMDLLLDNPNFRFADMKEACELEVKRKELGLTYSALTDYIHTKDRDKKRENFEKELDGKGDQKAQEVKELDLNKYSSDELAAAFKNTDHFKLYSALALYDLNGGLEQFQGVKDKNERDDILKQAYEEYIRNDNMVGLIDSEAIDILRANIVSIKESPDFEPKEQNANYVDLPNLNDFSADDIARAFEKMPNLELFSSFARYEQPEFFANLGQNEAIEALKDAYNNWLDSGTTGLLNGDVAGTIWEKAREVVQDRENSEEVSSQLDETITAKPDENTEPKQEPLKNQGIVASEENYQTLMKLYNGEATDAKELDNLIEWASENKEILEAKSAANYAIKFGTGQILKSVDAGFVLEIVEPLIMEKQENKKSWEELEKEAVEVTKKEAWVKKQLDDLPIRLQAGYSPQLIAKSLNDAYQRGDIVPPEWLHEVVRELDKNYGGVAVFIDENLKKEAIGKEKVSESNEQKEIAQAGENKVEVGLFDDEIVSKIVENKTNDRGNKTKTQASENIPEALDSKVAGYGDISAQKLAVSDYRSNNFDLDGVGAVGRAYKNIEALELSAKLNRENRFATKEEQEILAGFSGWGGCYGVFEETNKDFGEARKRLDKYLDENISNSVDRNLAFISMAHSSSSAYYTNTLLVDTIYKGLEQMGVNDNGVEKRVLEPSCGSGNFIIGSKNNSFSFTGIEIEKHTYDIAKHLNPNADIRNGGFETFIAKDSFDLVVGNPPYIADFYVNDTNSLGNNLKIANYFPIKSMENLRDGGIMAFVMPSAFLDHNGDKHLERLVEAGGKFLGAVRLPNNAFKGAEVNTDIVFFQKQDLLRNKDDKAINAELEAQGFSANFDMRRLSPEIREQLENKFKSVEDKLTIEEREQLDERERENKFYRRFKINDYFLNNPQNILGKFEIDTNRFGENVPVFKADENLDLKAELNRFIENLPKNIYKDIERETSPYRQFDFITHPESKFYIDNLKKGSFFIDNTNNGALALKIDSYEYRIVSDTEFWKNSLVASQLSKYKAGNYDDNKRQKEEKALKEQVLSYIELRDSLNTLLRAELDPNKSDEEIAKFRQDLNTSYDKMKLKYKKPLKEAFKACDMDLSFEFISNLENEKGEKALIFSQRISSPIVEPKVSNEKEALIASLSMKGKIDLDYIQDIYPNQSLDDTLNKLLEEKLIFKNHEPYSKEKFVTSDAYLSGNVKKKYNEVLEAIKKTGDKSLEINANSLKEVFPADRNIKEISFGLGMNWIPTHIYQEFIDAYASEYRFEGIERRGSDVADKVFEITLSSNGEYIIENNANTYTKNLVKNNAYYMAMLSSEKEREGKSRSTYGLNFGNGRDFFSYDEFKKHMGWSNEELNNAKRIPLVYAALPLALNRQKARIERSLGYIRDDETGEILKYKDGTPRIKKEFHKELSDDLNAMITQIQDKFLRFVLSNEDLRKEIEQAYNDKINTDRVRDFNTQTLDLKGANPNIKLYPHQNAGVWRGVQEQATLFNVNVGGGKTFMGAAVALEQKRMGLINKTLIVSPKTLVGSWEKEIKTLYPNANILALDEKFFTKDNRAKFLAKIQVNDYDAVIMSAEQFKLIPKNPEKTIANLALRLSMVKSDYDESKKDKKNTQLKKQIGKLEKQIQKARATADTIKKDNLVTFNELGIDCLIVDEAHLYKNLSYETQKTRVLGLGPQNGSDKAFDMKIVTDDFNDSGKKLYFLTGTPIANSMCELYHMQSFLQPKWLEDKGFYNFDNWANTFGEDVTDIEMGAGGEPKLVTRFARFNNLKELSGGFREVNFYANNEDIEKAAGQNFIPKVETIKEVIPRNEAISELYGEPDENGEFPKGSLLYRFGHFQENIKENNPLRLTNIARKAAVDYRLIEDKPENDFEVSKINKVVENVVDNYKNNHADEKGTQIIFLDLSVAKQKLKNISLDEDKKLKEENKTQGIESVSAEIKKSSRSDETLEPVFDKNGEEIKDDFRITYLSGEVEVFEAAEYVRELKALGIKLPKDLGNLRDLEEIEPNKFEMTGFSKIDIAAENDNKALKDVSFDAYSDIAKKLMKAGIPRDEIAFIHDYPKKADKDKLFEQMRNGEVRVLLGSTSKMGVGMNVQKRLVALHNVDYTWNPAGMEQRVGRIARQGNMFFEADKSFQPKVYNYATERTYDVKALQLLETKQKGIYMLQNADRLGLNSFEDISTAAMEFAEMKAIASGNPLMIEEFKIGNMLEKEERAFAFWESDKIVTENNLRNKTEKMIQNTKDIKTFGKMIETTNDYKSEVESKYKHLTKPIIVKIDRYRKYSWSEKNSPKEIGEVKKEVNDMLERSKLYISRVMNIGSNRSEELFADYKGVSVGVKLNTGKNSLGEPMHSLAICPSDNFDSNSAVALPKAKFRQEFFLSKDFNINYIMKKVDDELEKLPLLLDEAKAAVKTLEKEVEFGKNALNEIKEQGYPNQKLLNALRSDKKEILKHLKNKNNDWIPSYKKCLNSSSIENEKNTESKER